ncbi:O-acetyl-ADP-ribose deacetylase [candidate division WOR-3 bacterium]|nr:O-acetyl-ADP-ribose deacetylase [candidate division WOR-3 bacterium]
MKISAVRGDITKIESEAVVNAANEALLGGGGVDGAIHRTAGPELLDHCRKLGGCKTGGAKITPGFKMKAKYIIHTVGPVWRGGDKGEADLLEDCYKNCLLLAEENKIKKIAFPAVSTGVYGYPKNAAAETAVSTVLKFSEEHFFPEEVVFVCFSDEDLKIYLDVLSKTERI